MRPGLLVLATCVLVACRPAEQPEEQTSLDELAAEGLPIAPVLVNNGFEIPTVRITYRHEGAQQGTSILWIEDFGERAAFLNRIDSGGGPSDRRTYWDGERSYIQIAPGTPAAQSTFEPTQMQASAMVRFSDEQKVSLGWEPAGERTVAGQTCQIWRQAVNHTELCVWRGIDIQEITGMSPDGSFESKREAVEIVEGEAVPAEFAALAQ